MHDCLIIGGGVIGLTLAYQLAGEGLSVRVIERGTPGREASWAGAGILPPRPRRPQDDAYAQLAGFSYAQHPPLAEALREATGIDNGLRRCGGLYVARTAAEAVELARLVASWEASEVEYERLDAQALAALEPQLNLAEAAEAHGAYLLPGEYQLRNPRHCKALWAACVSRGVEISSDTAAEEIVVRNERLEAVRTADETLWADRFCFTTGAWSGELGQRLGWTLPVRPVRGQIVLLKCAPPPLARIVNVGMRYLVPRGDGRLLIGSTLEEAGFDCRNTAQGVGGLIDLALSLVPNLAAAPIERLWAGLRPATADGQPYLGRLPNLSNAFLAAGHYRAGLELSIGTAIVMSQLIRGATTEVDLTPFRLDRPATTRD